MSIFKGWLNKDGTGQFTAEDVIRGIRLFSIANVPAHFTMEAGDGTENTLWWDDSDNLRRGTSIPTAATRNNTGSVVTGASNAGANRTLSNLGTTAINADLLPVADTYDAGGASNYFAEGYITKIYGSSTATLTGSANTWTISATTTILGADGTDNDLICYGETAGQFMQWDGNCYSDAGALLLKDNVRLGFGAASATTGDIQMYSDGTNLVIEAAADDVIIQSGAGSDVDWVWESFATAGQDMAWIADIGTFQLCDDTILAIGGTTALTANDGFTFVFDGTATLNIDAVTAEDSLTIGESVSTDFEIHGTNYDILWDASEDELIFGDNVEVIWGAGKDLMIESDGTLVNFTFPATTSGIVISAYAAQTVSVLDINGDTDWDGADTVGMLHLRQDTPLIHRGASMFYVDNSGKPITNADGFMARFIDGSANTASTFAVEMYSAANNVMEMHTGAVGVIPLTIAPHTNATAPALSIDANTSGWVGAASKGIVNITQSGTLADAAASAVFIDFNGTYAANTVGGCINVDDDGTAGGTDYSVSVNSLGVNCMKLETQAATMTALTLEPATNATAAAFVVDGDANGFLGAANVGMVHIKNDIALTDVLSSTVLLDVGATKPIDAAEGYVLRIADTSVVATSNNSYAAYLDATANHGMKIETRAVLATNLTLSGVQAQTAPLLIIDASTGTGYDGADDSGALEITSDSILVANGSTLLRVESSAQQKAGSEGYLARFENTGAAQADAVAVEIVAKDSTEVALNCGAGQIKSTAHRYIVTDRKATDTGATTGTIAQGTDFIQCDTTTADDADIVLLPTAVAGTVLYILNDDSTQDFELTAAASDKINGGTAAGASTVGEGVFVRLVAVTDELWIATQFAADGTESKLDASA